MKHLKSYSTFLNESRSKWDGLASSLTKAVFKAWIKGYHGGMSEINYSDQVEDKLEFDLDATIFIDKRFKGFEVLDGTGADARDIDDDDDDQTPFINIYFGINPEWLPGEWSMVYFHLADVMRHEMEHITQDGAGVGNYKAGKPNEDDSELRGLIELGLLPKAQYMMLPKEVDANLHGLRFEAKKRKEPIIDAINRYLDTQEQGGIINSAEREEILDLWRRRAQKIGGIPKF
jgi:hypothetical protein